MEKVEIARAFRRTSEQVLLFPVVVVTLASAAFLCGGACAAWQWWLSVALALAYPWFREPRRVAAAADVFFIGVLAVFWLASVAVYDCGLEQDCMTCHFPLLRLLVEGWNPVADPSCESILGALGLSSDGMLAMHVTAYMKAVSVFGAVAHFFLRDPLTLTFPPVFFLSLGLLLTLVTEAERGHRLLAAFAAVLLVAVASRERFIDASLMLAAGGLLFTMHRTLADGRFRPVPFIAFGFWMLNAKAPGILAFLTFALLFCLACRQIRVLLSAGALLALTAAVSFSPYGTSWRDYGHPLYPARTSDPVRYPPINLLDDFDIGNADLAEMGFFGRYVNAYVSPGLARAYYNWKLGRDDFAPEQLVWLYSGGGSAPHTPLDGRHRFVLLATFALLAALPGCRMLALMMLAASLLFPAKFIGFMRYQPWIAGFAVLAFSSLLDWTVRRLRPAARLVPAGVVCALAAFVGYGVVRWTRSVEYKAEELACAPDEIVGCQARMGREFALVEGRSDWTPVATGRYLNGMRLFLRQTRQGGGCRVTMAECWKSATGEPPKGLRQTRFGHCVPERFGLQQPAPLPEAFVKSWFVRFPRLAWGRLRSS